ncbi:hypothetical protein EV175_005163 [Coemansia sp. RSA 1933]|nr:hypothetical protein EV175_005163 [Coemansia sp. RSA 1933]
MLARFVGTRMAFSQIQHSRSLFTSRVINSGGSSNTDAHAKKQQEGDLGNKSRPVSSAPHGTVLKGLNIYKEGKDPVALKDEEYPEWLWTILDNVPRENLSEREVQRLDRSKAVKEANFMKSKKK